MSNRLTELERLTVSEGATFTLKIRRGLSRATFKRPGKRAEAVSDVPSLASSVEGVLAELLNRMGYALDVPTADHVVAHATPKQLARMRELIGELQLIRATIANKHGWRPEQVEPRLASPRSSLHPRP